MKLSYYYLIEILKRLLSAELIGYIGYIKYSRHGEPNDKANVTGYLKDTIVDSLSFPLDYPYRFENK